MLGRFLFEYVRTFPISEGARLARDGSRTPPLLHLSLSFPPRAPVCIWRQARKRVSSPVMRAHPAHATSSPASACCSRPAPPARPAFARGAGGADDSRPTSTFPRRVGYGGRTAATSSNTLNY